jgi:hypothetical protein
MSKGDAVKVEDAEWNMPKGRGGRMSDSTRALRDLKVGECKRITHDDVGCLTANGHRNCSLAIEIKRLRASGWTIEYYHECDKVMVVRRTA